MKMKAAAISALALALALAAPAAAEKGKPPLTAQTARAGGKMIPEQAALIFDHADLAIEVFPDREQISGVATHRFTARQPVRRVVIDLDRNLPVSAVSLDGRPLGARSWSNPDGRLAIALPRTIAKGRAFTVEIRYGGTPHVAVRAPWDGGFTWAKTESGKPWVTTSVQGEGCDLFWPCIDHPMGEPALMDIRITVPEGLAAPSNGVLQSVTPQPGGRSTYHWRVKNPNTYGIALNIGPYKLMKSEYRSRYGNVIPIEWWHLEGHEKQAAGLAEEFAPTLDFYETLIGPYPFGDEKMGIVETPHLGMEHQTINAYGNEFKKAATGYDWLFHHEFAHEWFANQLTASDWDDFWLHEGFGAYMQPLYGRWRGGEFAYHAAMNTARNTILNRFPLVSGSPRASEEVYKPESGPGGDIYVKGAWMLHTLRELLGDTAFFDATRRLVYGRPDPRPGNFKPRYGSSAEFRSIVNQVTGKDLGWFFDIYLDEAALPDLVEERRGDRLDLRWKTPRNKPFPMPVEVEVDGRVQTVAMTGNKGSLAVPAGAHVVLDPSGKILRRSADIEAFQAWQKEQEAKAAAAKKAGS
jgi:aminopeptidase N